MEGLYASAVLNARQCRVEQKGFGSGCTIERVYLEGREPGEMEEKGGWAIYDALVLISLEDIQEFVGHSCKQF